MSTRTPATDASPPTHRSTEIGPRPPATGKPPPGLGDRRPATGNCPSALGDRKPLFGVRLFVASLSLLLAGCSGSPPPVVATPSAVPTASGTDRVAAAAPASATGLALPRSDSPATQRAPLELRVGPDALVLEPDVLLELTAEGALPPSAVSAAGLVPALHTELLIWVESRQRIARDSGLSLEASLALLADRTLPSDTWLPLASTALAAGLDTLELVVASPDGDAAADTSTAASDPPRVLAVRLVGEADDGALQVRLAPEAMQVRLGLEPLGELAADDLMGLYNLALAAVAERDAYSQVALERVRFVVEPGVPLERLAAAADAVRSVRLPAGDAGGSGRVWLPMPFGDVAIFAASVPALGPGGTVMTLLPAAELDVSR